MSKLTKKDIKAFLKVIVCFVLVSISSLTYSEPFLAKENEPGNAGVVILLGVLGWAVIAVIYFWLRTRKK